MIGINPDKALQAATRLDDTASVIDDVRTTVVNAMALAELQTHALELFSSLGFEFSMLAATLRPRAHDAFSFVLDLPLGEVLDSNYSALQLHVLNPLRSRPDGPSGNVLVLVAQDLARRNQHQDGKMGQETLERLAWDDPDPRVRSAATLLLKYPTEDELGSEYGASSERGLWHGVAQSQLERLNDGSLPFLPTDNHGAVDDIIGTIPVDPNHTPAVSLQYLWDQGHLNDESLYALAPPSEQRGDFVISTADFEPQPYWSEDEVQQYASRWIAENPDNVADPYAAGQSKLDEWIEVIRIAQQPVAPVGNGWNTVVDFAVDTAHSGATFATNAATDAIQSGIDTAQSGIDFATDTIQSGIDFASENAQPSIDFATDVAYFTIDAAHYGVDFIDGCVELADPVYTVTSEYAKDPRVATVATGVACVVGGVQYAGIPGVWDGTGEKILD